MKKEIDQFEVLRKIEKVKNFPRENLHKNQALVQKVKLLSQVFQNKGFVKLKIFKKPNKINYLKYVITPKGISERTKLTVNFMKRKMKEYDELKKELENINNEI